MTPIKLTAIGALLSAFSLSSTAQVVYYDVDFDSAGHVAGSAPLLNSDIDTPSYIPRGAPTVESAPSPMDSQALLLNTAGNPTPYGYDQIVFGLGRGADNYSISFDLMTENLIGSVNNFTVFLDTPIVQSLSLTRAGLLNTYNPYTDSVYNNVGSYTDDTLMRFNIDIDLVASLWTIDLNGTSIFDGDFYSDSGDIQNLRFSHGALLSGWTPDSNVNVWLDNVQVSSGFSTPLVTTVPEPASIGLLGLGLLGIVARRAGRRSSKIS